jgi:hypothetical protein
MPGTTLTADAHECTERLAKFFPALPAIRIPVLVQSLRPGPAKLRESAVLEFGAPEYAIFLSTLPLEFDERIRLTREGLGRPAEAVVIALQYHEGRKAVAVRFLEGRCDWMTQP